MGGENQNPVNPITQQPGQPVIQPNILDAEPKTDIQMVTYKHPKTGIDYKVPKEVLDGFNHQFGMARATESSKWEDKFKALSSEYNNSKITLEQYESQLRQIEEEKLSETDKIKRQFEREIKTRDSALKEFQDKAEKNYSLFRDTKIDNDLIGAISGIGNGIEAANPQQLSLLLKTLGKAELVEENGNFVTKISLTIDGEIIQMSPKEAVIKFLSLPENAHHIKNNLRSGGGTSSAGTRTNGSGIAVFTKSDMSDPVKRKQYLDLSKAGKEPILE